DCFDNAEIDGETSQSFSPSENGSYAVEISVDECIAFSECEEIIITSVEPTIEHLEIDLFPNPIINLLTVKFEHSNEISISIYNVYGKEVYQNVTFGGSSSISTITWSSGIYFVHVLDQSSSEVEIFKVIKK
ncbi:MAG: T9SS type A sorting domain-containing protein, partial [Flavobacteriales bacterium]